MDGVGGRIDQEDVPRLQVPVHDALLMDPGQGAGGLVQQLRHLLRRQGATPLQARRQLLPLEELHHHVRLTALQLVEVGDGDNVRVAQAGDDLGLHHEAGARGGVLHHGLVQHLDREPLLGQAHMLRLVHLAHPAPGHEAADPVGLVQDLPLGEGGHGVSLQGNSAPPQSPRAGSRDP